MARRSGFTIVEMLVTIALIMLIMAILSTSFIVGLDTFSKLKALGDMSERLRGAVSIMRRDLDADHFEGRIRTSDPQTVYRPREGFVRVIQFQPSTPEGNDSTGTPSTRGVGHVLHLAVKYRGNRPEDFFRAKVPAGSPLLQRDTTFFNQPLDARFQDRDVYMCQWGEVAYYLQPLTYANGTAWTTYPYKRGLPLYSLHRITRACVVDNRAANQAGGNLTDYPEVSCKMDAVGGNLHFNSPRDLTDPTRRSIDVSNLPFTIDTILLTDVISFDIKILQAPQIPAPAGQRPVPFGYPIGQAEFIAPPGGAGEYDSATANYGVLAIQITLRIWDLKSQQTRQITMIQDL